MDEWMNGFPFTFHLSLFTLPELVAQARECFAFVQCVNPIKVWVASCEDLSFHLSPFTFNLYLGGYSAEVPPLPIPNRVVKLSIADGTALRCGRVGSRHFEAPLRIS